MKIQKIALILAVALFGIFSCKKKDEKKDPESPATTNVYITGNSDSAGAVYWKNGEMYLKGMFDPSRMVIDNGNVYSPTQNGYLKNDEQINLPHASRIDQIAMHENDIYAVGIADTNTRTFYWKNNEMKYMLPNNKSGKAKFISVSGNSVFLGGGESDFSIWYWQNDVFNICESKGFAFGMISSNEEVYIYGMTDHSSPTYWKNSIAHTITIPHNDSMNWINDMRIVNNDIYLVIYGSGSDWPLYWKNNHPIGIGLLDNATRPVSIAVDGKDVYVVGNEPVLSNNGNNIIAFNIVMWKNGVKKMVIRNAQAQKIIVSH